MTPVLQGAVKRHGGGRHQNGNKLGADVHLFVFDL